MKGVCGCGPCTAASRAAGRARLPWLAADVPKVIRASCPVRGMAGLSPGVARFIASLRLAACLRGVAFSSRSSLAWPSSCHELRPPTRVTTFRQAQVVLESKGFSPGRSALFRNGCYTAGRIGAPLLGVPALQGLTGRSCCGFRRCSPLALGRAAQADAGASGYRRIVQRRWNLSAHAATPSWAFFPLASCACDGLRRVCRSLAGCRVHW